MKNSLKIASNKYKTRILVIDDEPEIGRIFIKVLTESGYDVISSQSGRDGLNKFRKFKPSLVFLDLQLPDNDGISILREVKKIDPDVITIMITAHAKIETAVKAVKLGAYDFIPKPIPITKLPVIVDKAMKKQQLSKQAPSSTRKCNSFKQLIGQSKPMQDLMTLLKTVALHDVNVIIRGESGTGKELAANAVHDLSRRKDGPFVAVDCSTLPETLVESELFGYEKGAFTGADVRKSGRFEQAEGGTIFLDEIGNFPVHIQAKLLRVLQERKVERLGGRKIIRTDIRLISATNMDLEGAVSNGEFREDLYHRLNVFEITLPPLRERGSDIALLSQYFLDQFNGEMGKNVKGFSYEVLKLFKEYQWPGNVRELENAVKYSMVLSEDMISVDHVTPHIMRNIVNATIKAYTGKNELLDSKMTPDEKSFKETNKSVVEKAEKHYIEKTLHETNWNKKRASEILDIDYKSLYNKIKKYNLKRRFYTAVS